MAQEMTYKDFEARMAAARAAHLKNIDITAKKPAEFKYCKGIKQENVNVKVD